MAAVFLAACFGFSFCPARKRKGGYPEERWAPMRIGLDLPFEYLRMVNLGDLGLTLFRVFLVSLQHLANIGGTRKRHQHDPMPSSFFFCRTTTSAL